MKRVFNFIIAGLLVAAMIFSTLKINDPIYTCRYKAADDSILQDLHNKLS